MWYSNFLLAAAIAHHALAVPAPSSHVSHERRNIQAGKWVKRAKISDNVVLPMRISLTQSNLHLLDQKVMEISDPDSPKYGQHMTSSEVIDLFAPAESAVEAVKSWLVSAGVAAHRIGSSANKQWLQFEASVEEAERLLATEYYAYEHRETGYGGVACDEYHVPSHVQEHIDYITPGVKLLAGKKKVDFNHLSKRGFKANGDKAFSPPVLGSPVTLPSTLNETYLLSMCDTYVTPPCIAKMYNITAATKAKAGNELGIFEEGDFYAAEDLVEFFTLFTNALIPPNIPPTTMPKLDSVDGGYAPSAYAGGESDLDFQISYPIIYPQQEILFQTDDLNYALGLEGGGGFLNTFFDAIDGSYCNYTAYGETGNAAIDPVYPDPLPTGYQGKLQCGKYKPTNVISISYGEQEDDLPTNYQQRQCSEVAKLGMQGITVVLASGDSGVAARSTDDGNADGCLGNGEVFNPDFPASCPYILAVGATYLTGDVNKDEEVAVTRFPSGGGFSNIYKQPSYQASALKTFFKSHPPTYKSYSLTTATNNPSEAQTKGGLYNKAGRGYPDVSAVGDNVLIINNGAPTLIGGTSASAPVVAAILNRINEERLAVGKKTVGFVNPTLYKNPHAFHDITVGNNSGCGTPGFYAGAGWDPVTGLGTPNYPALLKVFMALP